MRRLIAVFLVVILCVVTVFAQPGTLWTRTYGGSNDDVGASVQQTQDGGYIIAGYTESYGLGDMDVYFIKTNDNGDTVWTRTFGGYELDIGYSVQQTSDGGYIIAGWTESYGAGSYDVYLIKTNSNGDTSWTRTFGGTSYDYGRCVKQTTDEGYIIAGSTDSYSSSFDVYLIKTDINGSPTWIRTYGGMEGDGGQSVYQTLDEGFIIAGNTQSYGEIDSDVYLIKTNTNGDTLWTKIYGGTLNDGAKSVQQTSDRGYIIAGNTASFGGYYDFYLIKTDSIGDSLWTRTFGGSSYDSGWCVRQTTDNGYIVSGFTQSYGSGENDVYLIKTNADGDTIWTQTFGGGNDDNGLCVQQTLDGGYIITGYTANYSAGGTDVWLIRLDSEGSLVGDFGSLQPYKFTFHPAYPNPFNMATNISFETAKSGDVSLAIYDIQGKEVARLIDGYRSAGAHQVDFDGSGLPSGVYFARLRAGDYEQTQKVLLVK